MKRQNVYLLVAGAIVILGLCAYVIVGPSNPGQESKSATPAAETSPVPTSRPIATRESATPQRDETSATRTSFQTRLRDLIATNASPRSLADEGTKYWVTNFRRVVTMIDLAPVNEGDLRSLFRSYEFLSSPKSQEAGFDLVFKQAETQAISSVGVYHGDANELKDLWMAFGVSIAGTAGKSLPQLMSVLEQEEVFDASDILAFRLMKDAIGPYLIDNALNLGEQDRAYEHEDYQAFIALAGNRNPVIRLCVLEMIANNYSLASSEPGQTSEILNRYASEANPMVIERLLRIAYLKRFPAFKEPIARLSDRLRADNPALAQEAAEVSAVLRQ